jgi:hypothetical protein
VGVLTGLGFITPPKEGAKHIVIKKWVWIGSGVVVAAFALFVFAGWYQSNHVPYSVTLRIRDMATEQERVCAETTATGEAGKSLDDRTKVEMVDWVVRQLLFEQDGEVCAASGQARFVQLHVDVPKHGAPTITPAGTYELMYWSRDQPEETHGPFASDDPALASELAARKMDVYLQIRVKGFKPSIVFVPWNEGYEDDVVLAPDDFTFFSIAVEEFKGEENIMASTVEDVLLDYDFFAVMDPAAMVRELANEEPSGGNQNPTQIPDASAVRTSIFLINGSYFRS